MHFLVCRLNKVNHLAQYKNQLNSQRKKTQKKSLKRQWINRICEAKVELGGRIATVSPKTLGNLMTIVNMSTSAQLSRKINLLRSCVPANQVGMD